MMIVYLIYYDCDHGNREDWNVFYTPLEIYTDEQIWKDRQAYLEETLPDDYHIEAICQGINNKVDGPIDIED